MELGFNKISDFSKTNLNNIAIVLDQYIDKLPSLKQNEILAIKFKEAIINTIKTSSSLSTCKTSQNQS